MIKLASANFHKPVKVPNSEAPVSGCHAIGNLANKDGLTLEYDEEYGFLRIVAVTPRTLKDAPRCVLRENISDFVLAEDLEEFTKNFGKKK